MVGPVRRRLPQFALAALALATTIAGCGGDDSEPNDYREMTSALCAEAKRAAENVSPPRSRRDWEPFLRETVEFSRDYNRRFDALEPPPELADEHARWLRLNLRAEQLTEGMLDDLAAGDALKELLPRYLDDIIAFSRRSNALAREMGVLECVTPLPVPGGETPAPA
jgi:hypothetical protein